MTSAYSLARAAARFDKARKRGGDMSSQGTFVWHELMTRDAPAAAAFYQKITGWGTQAFASDEPYTLWTVRGTPVGGLMTLPPYVNVIDIDSALAQTQALGGRVLNGPMDVPGEGKIAQCIDPQGAAFAVYADPYTRR
jgi:predicted enzyme related to lactoylglutathione lyase